MKKLTTLILVVTMLLSTSLTAFAYIAGDTDNDFEVTAGDARFTLRLAVGLEECDEESDQFKAADADGNGTVTAGDARIILRVAVGLEAFPDNTSAYGNITATKMPYTTNGLTINSLTFNENGKIVLSITNNTGKTDKAVSTNSFIPYKMYNADGNVIYSGSVYVEQMNPGDSCSKTLPLNDGAVRIIFGSATVKYTDLITVTETTDINGITVSKPPFTVNGITVNSIAIDTERRHITADITNNTGKSVYGSVKFICYDANGNSLDKISVSILRLNAGEKSREYDYYPTGTAKIIFSEVSLSDRDTFIPLTTETANLNGIEVTKTPVSSNGIALTIQDISDRNIMTVKVTNNTGSAIESTSYSTYKEYDAEGYLIASGNLYFSNLNAGESCISEIYLNKDATKVLLGNITIYEGTTLNPGATTTIDGVLTNSMPLNLNGLILSDFSVVKRGSSYMTVSLKVTNSTGKPIASYSSFIYKALTSDNTVIESRSSYVHVNLNNGEYCYRTLDFDVNTAKLYFFANEIEDSDEVILPSASYSTLEGIKITSAPYSNNNLTVTSYKIENDRLYLVIKNNTGSTVSGLSHLNYKVVGADGSVLSTSAEYCEEMNKGESCEVSFYIPDGAATISFGSFYVKTK